MSHCGECQRWHHRQVFALSHVHSTRHMSQKSTQKGHRHLVCGRCCVLSVWKHVLLGMNSGNHDHRETTSMKTLRSQVLFISWGLGLLCAQMPACFERDISLHEALRCHCIKKAQYPNVVNCTSEANRMRQCMEHKVVIYAPDLYVYSTVLCSNSGGGVSKSIVCTLSMIVYRNCTPECWRQ